MSVSVTLLVLTASRDLHGLPSPPRRHDVLHAAGAAANPSSRSLGRVQGPAPRQSLAMCKPLLGSSCLCPQLRISHHSRAGGTNEDPAKPFIEVKSKRHQRWHPSGAWWTSSGHRLTGDNMVCGVQLGTGCGGSPRPLPGTTACRHTGNKLIPTSHCDSSAALKGWRLLARNHL